MNKIILLLFVFVSELCSTIFAKDKLLVPAQFLDNLILQLKKVVNIWEWNKTGTILHVASSRTTAKDFKTIKNSIWEPLSKTSKAVGPNTLALSNKNSVIHITNIYIRGVWVCSQSNKDTPLKLIKKHLNWDKVGFLLLKKNVYNNYCIFNRIDMNINKI